MKRKDKIFLTVTFSLFLTLILMGIGAKRLLDHREWVIPLHLSAAIVLAFWAHRLFKIRSSKYAEEVAEIRK